MRTEETGGNVLGAVGVLRAGFRPSPAAGTRGGAHGLTAQESTTQVTREGGHSCPEREAQGSATPGPPGKQPRTPVSTHERRRK